MKVEKKYILKFDELIYYNVTFDEITKILLNDVENVSPVTNRLLLIEILKVLCVIENKKLNIINSKDYELDYLFDYNLIIDDDSSIIDIINDLQFAEIIECRLKNN